MYPLLAGKLERFDLARSHLSFHRAGYAVLFFLLPVARAFLNARENVRVKERNALRKAAAGEALQAMLGAIEDGRAAAAAKHRAPLQVLQ
jgi:hypothetical protein